MVDKIKETGIYFIGTIGVAVISFIISLLYTRMFTTDGYGYYSLVAALYNLLFQLFTGWMTHSILRFFPEEKEKDNARGLRSTMVFIHMALCVGFVLIMLVCMLIYRDTSVLYQMFLIYNGVFMFEGLLQILNTFFRAEGNSRQYSFNTVCNSIIKSVLIVILFYILQFRSIVVIVVSLFLTELIQCIYVFMKFKWYKAISIRAFDFKLTKKVIAFGYPLIGVSVIFNILTYSDRYIVNLFWTKSDVGLYSYGYNMGYSLFYTMTNAIMLGAYPKIVAEWQKNGRKSTETIITSYLNLYFYLMIPATMGIIVIGRTVIQCLCGSDYWDSTNVFIITCISYALFGFLQYTNKAWELTAKTKIILYLNAVVALLNIALNFMLIGTFGYTVAAVTTMISFLIYIICSLILSRNIITFIIDSRSLFKIFTASVVMAGVVGIIDYITPCSVYMMICEIMIAVIVYVIMLILFRDKITIDIIKRIRRA